MVRNEPLWITLHPRNLSFENIVYSCEHILPSGYNVGMPLENDKFTGPVIIHSVMVITENYIVEISFKEEQILCQEYILFGSS